jgi:hypothetical protein
MSIWLRSYCVPIFPGQTWKDKQKERYYRVAAVGKGYVICRKLFFGDSKLHFRKKDFRRSMFLM